VVEVMRGAVGRGLRRGTFATLIARPFAGGCSTPPTASPAPPPSPPRAAILVEGRLG
jgi:hypothetical protein